MLYRWKHLPVEEGIVQAVDSTEFAGVHSEEEVLKDSACSQLEEDMGAAVLVVEVRPL